MNFMILSYLWIWPQSAKMFQIIFLCSNGPLAWSMLTFSHSLIFHSRPHMTSVFIHCSPMLLTYAIRWYPSEKFSVCNYNVTGSGGMPCDIAPSTLLHTCIFGFYIWWCLIYYVWVFLVLWKHLRDNQLEVLYDRVTKKGPLKVILGSFEAHQLIKKVIYLLIYLAFGIFTMTFATIFWHNRFNHFLFCLVMVMVTVWNASGFYRKTSKSKP